MTQQEDDSELPPLPPDHGFNVGDRVELPVYRQGKIEGCVEKIDIEYGTKRYRGLAVLGDDGRYYELDPRVAKKLSKKTPKKLSD